MYFLFVHFILSLKPIFRVIFPEIEKAYPTDCIDILLPIKDWPNNTKEKESGENKLFLGRSLSRPRSRRSYWTGTSIGIGKLFPLSRSSKCASSKLPTKTLSKNNFLRSHFTIFAKKLSYDYVSIEICAYI